MANPQKIDAYLGRDSWTDYNDMESKFKGEQARNDGLKRTMSLAALSPLFDQSWIDLLHLEKITREYWNGLNMISDGRRPLKARFDDIFFLWSLAYEIAQEDNDLLEAMFMSGLVTVMMHFPFTLLEGQAKVMLKALGELKKELRHAEVESVVTKLKAKFHEMLIGIEILVPELSLLARAGIFVGEALVNEVLAAPDHPTTFQKVEGVATPGVKQLSEAVHKVKGLHFVSKVGDRGAAALTVYLDREEIAEAGERKEKLGELVDEVNDAYKHLVNSIRDHLPQLAHFEHAFERWVKSIAQGRQETEANREKFIQEMDKAHYSLYSAMVWPGQPP